MSAPAVLTRHRIRVAREAANLTQGKLARRVGVAAKTIANWEAGRSVPGKYALLKLSRECDVDLEWLRLGDDAVPMITCPVCHRQAAVTGPDRIVALHNDKARFRCPMVGEPAPIEPELVCA